MDFTAHRQSLNLQTVQTGETKGQKRGRETIHTHDHCEEITTQMATIRKWKTTSFSNNCVHWNFAN